MNDTPKYRPDLNHHEMIVSLDDLRHHPAEVQAKLEAVKHVQGSAETMTHLLEIAIKNEQEGSAGRRMLAEAAGHILKAYRTLEGYSTLLKLVEADKLSTNVDDSEVLP